MSSSQMEKKYFEKCLALLNSEQFVKSNQDPTAITERKVQQILRKIRQLFKNKNYQKKYMKSYIQQGCQRESFMESQRFINCHETKVFKNFL